MKFYHLLFTLSCLVWTSMAEAQPYSIPLVAGVPLPATTSPAYYNFTSNNYWDVVGLRASGITDDWDIYLYPDITFTVPALASSYYGAGIVDFVVVDGNHAPAIARGVKAERYSGSGSAWIHFDGGNEQLNPGMNTGLYWSDDQIVKAWDIYLTPGTYRFNLDIINGIFNPGIALFSSEGGNLYQGRSAAKAMADNNGQGQGEEIIVNITEDDWYGVVAWANDSATASYFINVEKAGTWTGAVSNNWFDPGNWSAQMVPTAGIDVNIPLVVNKPWIYSGADASCHNLTVNPGSGNYLRIYDGKLTVNGDARFYGQLMMDHDVPSAQLWVSGSVFWEEESTAWTSENIEIKISGNMEFITGSNVQMDGGEVLFTGNTDSHIINYQEGSAFYRLSAGKTGASVYFSTLSSNPLSLQSNLTIHPGAAFNIDAPQRLHVAGDINDQGSLHCNAGGVSLNGSNQMIGLNAGSYFNDLEINASGNVNLNSSIQVTGDLDISHGTFKANEHTVALKGNWTDLQWPDGFDPGTGRVIFNGADYPQFCTDENFNILEINKWVYENAWEWSVLSVDGYQITCESYDWTSGGIMVHSGSFTADSLADNGISGGFAVDPAGTVDLKNYNGWVDLNGDLSIAGTFNVWGGTGISRWPYTHDAHVNIYISGVIDFKNTGIFMNDLTPFSCSITGWDGLVRTTGDILYLRSTDPDSLGWLECYGGGDAHLNLGDPYFSAGLKINKANDSLSDNPDLPRVILDADVHVRTVRIENGTLNSNDHDISFRDKWENMVGEAGFLETTSTVSFDNPPPWLPEIMTSETFYRLAFHSVFAWPGQPSQARIGGGTIRVLDKLEVTAGFLGIYSDSLFVHDVWMYSNSTDTIVLVYFGNQDSTYVEVTGDWIEDIVIEACQTFVYPQAGLFTLVFNGTEDQEIRSCYSLECELFADFGNIIIDKPSGLLTFTGSLPSLWGDLVMISGTVDMGGLISLGGACRIDSGLVLLPGDKTLEFSRWYASKASSLSFHPAKRINSIVLDGTWLSLESDVFLDTTNGGGFFGHCVGISSASLNLKGHTLQTSYIGLQPDPAAPFYPGAMLIMPKGSQLKVSEFVAVGGSLMMDGSPDSNTIITRMDGTNSYFSMSVYETDESDTFYVKNAVFEYIHHNGIELNNLFDPYVFTNCTFREGEAGGTLIRAGGYDTIIFYGAVFPENTWGGAYNVSKPYDDGIVYFIDYSGEFAGPAFENDPYNRIHWILTGSGSVQGTVSYDNAQATGLSQVTVTLKQGGNTKASAITGPDGHYKIDNIPPGTYDVQCTSVTEWGGCNAADALLVLKHFAEITLLGGIRLLAANVDNLPQVNAIDALLIAKRFAGIISSFQPGDWVFTAYQVVIAAGTTANQDIKALCTGDVNGSYVPPY